MKYSDSLFFQFFIICIIYTHMENQSLKLCSWNICFGCMTSKDPVIDRSARHLAEYCTKKYKETGKNICLDNVVNVLNKKKYDFIGLQEATNGINIYKQLKTIYPSYRYTHSHCGPAEIITIYDSDKFVLDYITCGDLGYTEKGRPYQILFLTKIDTKHKIILVNLHSPHEFGNSVKRNFSRMLSNDLPKSYNNNGLKFNLCNLLNRDNISEYINKYANDFNTIIMGDFNDHGNFNIWTGFKLFKYLENNNNIKKISNILVKSFKQPPKTCCVGHVNKRSEKNKDSFYGDYILIDPTKMEYIKENIILKTDHINIFDGEKFPTSDHLPIYSEIKFLDSNVYHKKYLKYKYKYLLLKNIL